MSLYNYRDRRKIFFTPLTLLVATLSLAVLTGCQVGGDTTGTSNKPSSTGSGTPIPSLTGTNTEAIREAVIAKVQPAVVQINVKTAQGGGLGSGVIIDRRGYIITNNHVVQGYLTNQTR